MVRPVINTTRWPTSGLLWPRMKVRSQAIFTADVSSSPSGVKVNFRFHNSNNTSGSWSSTKSVITSPILQSISGHIYLCSAGAPTTTEVPGGSLSASGPQSVASQPNPLGVEALGRSNTSAWMNRPNEVVEPRLQHSSHNDNAPLSQRSAGDPVWSPAIEIEGESRCPNTSSAAATF